MSIFRGPYAPDPPAGFLEKKSRSRFKKPIDQFFWASHVFLHSSRKGFLFMTAKDPAAVALGKKRMKGMTDEQRIEFSKKGIAARTKIPKKKRKAHASHAAKVRWAEKRKKDAAEAKKRKAAE
jgi:hypothetical protein